MAIKFTAITRRRLANFRANRRAFWSLWVFLVLFGVSLFAEVIANDKPLLVRFNGEWRMPFTQFYSEADFGGEYLTEADYLDPLVQCLIRSDGDENCFEDASAPAGEGRILWAPVRYSFNTISKEAGGALAPPSARHWFGTDKEARDVFARVLYGFRLTVLFAMIVSGFSALIAITLGAIMGYFGGRVDLYMQRFVEIWTTMPTIYVILILSSMIPINFYSMSFIVILFSWTGLVGLVRAEFLRARNFEYVRAARALGVANATIIRRHVLPNAMVATITYLPFLITGAVGTLATLDYLGLGLPASYPSLGEMAREARAALHGWWLIWAAFATYTVLLSLLVFIFEGVRDAFDPRKVFA